MNEIDAHLERPLSTQERFYSLAIVYIPILVTIYCVFSGLLFSIHLGTLVLFLVCYTLTVLGVTIGFHRLLTHRSFKTHRIVKIIFVSLGCMAYEGSPFFWVAAHRRHHKFTDTLGDPHSPVSDSFFHAHMGWMSTHTLETWLYYIRDLIVDKDLRLMNRYYFTIAFSGLLIPALINGLLYNSLYQFYVGFMVCGLVRVCIQQHVTWSINSVCHKWGKKHFETADQSRNNWFCAILSHGEGWHNGHHAFPQSARHGLKNGQVDISYYVIKSLEYAGLAKDIKLPTSEQIKAKDVNLSN